MSSHFLYLLANEWGEEFFIPNYDDCMQIRCKIGFMRKNIFRHGNVCTFCLRSPHASKLIQFISFFYFPFVLLFDYLNEGPSCEKIL